MFALNHRTALVTGGAKGIGKGIAATLREAGAQVLIADIDRSTGEQTAGELGAHFVELDVRSQTSCFVAVDAAVQRYGRLDILCSNTGIFPNAPLDTMTEADWDATHNVNLKGMFFIVQAALKVMQKQQHGRVVLTSSITGPVTGFPGWAHYGASKAGQLGFMRSAALEYARFGITINAVMPGNILTEGLQAQGETYLAQMRAAIPTHTLGTPRDIGTAACFFASDEAAYITGQTLIIDGGQVLLEQRPGSGIWGGLLSLPELDGHVLADGEAPRDIDQAALARAVAPFGTIETQERLLPIVHVFTHYKLHIVPCRITLARRLALAGEATHVWYDGAKIADAPLPAPIKKLLLDLFGDARSAQRSMF